MRTLFKNALVLSLSIAPLTFVACQAESVAPQAIKTTTAVADSLADRPMDDQPPKDRGHGGN